MHKFLLNVTKNAISIHLLHKVYFLINNNEEEKGKMQTHLEGPFDHFAFGKSQMAINLH
jgi:hypothetical protein